MKLQQPNSVQTKAQGGAGGTFVRWTFGVRIGERRSSEGVELRLLHVTERLARARAGGSWCTQVTRPGHRCNARNRL